MWDGCAWSISRGTGGAPHCCHNIYLRAPPVHEYRNTLSQHVAESGGLYSPPPPFHLLSTAILNCKSCALIYLTLSIIAEKHIETVISCRTHRYKLEVCHLTGLPSSLPHTSCQLPHTPNGTIQQISHTYSITNSHTPFRIKMGLVCNEGHRLRKTYRTAECENGSWTQLPACLGKTLCNHEQITLKHYGTSKQHPIYIGKMLN